MTLRPMGSTLRTQTQAHSQENVQSANIARTVIITNYSTKWHQQSKNKDVFSILCECLFLWRLTLTAHLHWGHRVRYLPNLSSGRLLWRHCECCKTHTKLSTSLFKCILITSFSAPWLHLDYLFQVALAPALFCFSPLSSGELFSLFPSSLRLGELINFSRCRVLMGEIWRKWREREMH